MNEHIEFIINRIISEVRPEWQINEKMRFVYIEVGKELTKDVAFFYSLGKKMEEENLSFTELKSRYDDNVPYNEVICKSAAIILKRIYDKIGIECDLIQSVEGQRINDSDDFIDIYHWFLCCTGDNEKKYFLTLVPDLVNIQNNWQTEHFASAISHKTWNDKVVYQGKPISETVMTNEEIAKLDMRIGYLKPKRMDKIVPTVGNLNIEDFIYYENDGDSSKKSISIYQQIISNISSRKGYTAHLARNTDFYKSLFKFKNRHQIEVDFLEFSLSNVSEEDLDDWYLAIHDYITHSTLPINIMFLCEIQLKSAYENLKKAKELCNIISEEKLNNKIEDESTIKIKKQVKTLIRKAHNTLGVIANNFVPKEYLPSDNKSITEEYLIHRFEKLIPLLLVCNDPYNLPMTARCNGIGEQLALIEQLFKDIFSGDILKKSQNPRIIHITVYNTDTKDYDILFQIDKENFYYLNPRSGEFRNVPDIFAFASKQTRIILNDSFKERINEIEKEMNQTRKR